MPASPPPRRSPSPRFRRTVPLLAWVALSVTPHLHAPANPLPHLGLREFKSEIRLLAPGQEFPLSPAENAPDTVGSASGKPTSEIPPRLTRTGISTDLAIQGPGFFILRVSTAYTGISTRQLRLTRNAALHLGAEGELLSNDGEEVLGLTPDGLNLMPLRIHWNHVGSRGNALVTWSITPDGWIRGTTENGNPVVFGRIALWIPHPNSHLRRLDSWHFADPQLDIAENLDPVRSEFIRAPEEGAVPLKVGYLEAPVPGLALNRFDRKNARFASNPPIQVVSPYFLYLDGPGFFSVRDPKTGRFLVTRCGAMKLDADGWLVTTPSHYRVQGWTNAARSGLGDIRVGHTPEPPGFPEDPIPVLVYSRVDEAGNVRLAFSDGTEVVGPRIRLAHFRQPSRLIDVGDSFYSGLDDAEPWTPAASPTPGTRILSSAIDPQYLTPRVLEAIRVQYRFLYNEFVVTRQDTSLAFFGDGFFILRNPATGDLHLTQLGLFDWSDDGFLVGIQGWRVQGAHADRPDATVLSDVRTLTGRRPDALTPCSFDPIGRLHQQSPDGTTQVAGQVARAQVPDPTCLVETGAYLYSLPKETSETPCRMTWALLTEHSPDAIFAGALEVPWSENLQPRIPSPPPDRGTQIQTFGLAGYRGRIQFSPDLTRWTDRFHFYEDGKLYPAIGFSPEPVTVPWVHQTMAIDTVATDGNHGFYRILIDEWIDTAWGSAPGY